MARRIFRYGVARPEARIALTAVHSLISTYQSEV